MVLMVDNLYNASPYAETTLPVDNEPESKPQAQDSEIGSGQLPDEAPDLDP